MKLALDKVQAVRARSHSRKQVDMVMANGNFFTVYFFNPLNDKEFVCV
jgi:hypothetical protein